MNRNTSSANRRQKNKTFWTPTRIVATLLTMSLLVAVGVSSCQSSDETAKVSRPTSTAPVRTAPPPAAPPAVASLPASVREAELKAANGRAIKLGDYSGKVLLVNLWATWCGP